MQYENDNFVFDDVLEDDIFIGEKRLGEAMSASKLQLELTDIVYTLKVDNI